MDEKRGIEGHVFAGILVSQPMRDTFSIVTGDTPWISVTPFADEQYWNADFNDQAWASTTLQSPSIS